VLWGDNARLAISSKYIEFNSVNDYPLHTITGNIFSKIPVGNFYFRQGLRVALFASLTVVILFLIVNYLTSSLIISLFTSLAFAFSHTFWLLAEMNEAFILAQLIVAVQILFLVKWQERDDDRFLYLAAFLFGLSMLAHRAMIFCIFGYGYFVIAKKQKIKVKLKQVLLSLIFFCIGAAPILYLLLTGLAGKSSGAGFSLVKIANILFTETIMLTKGKVISRLVYFPAYMFYQFPGVGFLIGCLGFYAGLKKRRNLTILILLIIMAYFLFFLFYLRQRIFFIILPSYFAFAVLIGMGLEKLSKVNLFKSKYAWRAVLTVLVVIPLFGYNFVPYLVKKFKVGLGTVRRLKYRDNYKYYLVPDKRGDDGAYRYAMNAFSEAEKNSLIVGDFNPCIVLIYFQKVENLRKDIKIEGVIDNFYYRTKNPKEQLRQYIDEYIDKSPVYLADTYEPYYFISYLRQFYKIIPGKSLTRIERK
jgi:hypothetical protein